MEFKFLRVRFGRRLGHDHGEIDMLGKGTRKTKTSNPKPPIDERWKFPAEF